VDQLVYYEEYASLEDALKRETQIKKYRRQKKDLLVQKLNPQWIDLFEKIQS
jgi:putative endonuclease